MRKGNLKRMAFVLTGIIVVFIAPLVVFAAIYSSKEKENKFAPAEANIQIEEKETYADTQTQTYTFPATTDSNGNFGVEKIAAVDENDNPNGEYMRVRFVPSWYDASGNGNIRAGVEDISDFKTIELDRSTESEAKYLLFKNSSGKTIISLELTEKKENGVVIEKWSDDWVSGQYSTSCNEKSQSRTNWLFTI